MLALLTLVGCGGKIRRPSYYVLNLPAPVSAAPPTTSTLGSVGVGKFDAPRFLRVGPIAYRESPEQLDFYDYHQWAEDPRRAITVAMMEELQARGLFQSVELFNGHSSPECLVTGTIDHLEEVDQGSDVSVEVALSARLINVRTGEVLWKGTSTKNAKVSQRSVPAVVAQMSQEVRDVVQGLVSSMQARVLATLPSPSRANAER